MLASVRFLTVFPSRKLSRMRMAGGEVRFGMRSTNMAAMRALICKIAQEVYMDTFMAAKSHKVGAP